jgi:hypothetical protein
MVTQPVLGLRANILQFSLLVLVNAFVGGMVGIERSILPALAKDEFGLAGQTAIGMICYGLIASSDVRKQKVSSSFTLLPRIATSDWQPNLTRFQWPIFEAEAASLTHLIRDRYVRPLDSQQSSTRNPTSAALVLTH